MNKVSLTTASMGYLHALGRFDKVWGKGPSGIVGPWNELFISLHESLTWLDMLLDREEISEQVDPDLALAFKFVRGRSHHAWADALELRDVELAPGPAVMLASGHVTHLAPIRISDWCWRQPETLAGGRRAGGAAGIAAYREKLARQQVRPTLDVMTGVLARVSFLSPA